MQTRNKQIQSQHLSRMAVIYIRQSTPAQVRLNQESTRLQYSLKERALELGWPSPKVISDLGISGSGFAHRPGFRELLTLITTKQVGIVLSLDISRLSRNSKDWASLFEICAYFDTLIADAESVYSFTSPNDRLLLGIKGAVSEVELSVLRVRLLDGANAKASRGKLRFNLPAGYVWDGDDIVLNPDQRIQDALRLLFTQFDKVSSVRQLTLWYKEKQIEFPVRYFRASPSGKTSQIVWSIPSPRPLLSALQNPLYAGAYVYGKRPVKVGYKEGRLVKYWEPPLPAEQCRVFIREHHEGYLTWAKYESNLRKISEARPIRRSENRGAVRNGQALLNGLLRCGHCGRRLYVQYAGRGGTYYCMGEDTSRSESCVRFSMNKADQCISEALCQAVSPLAIKAALGAYDLHLRDQTQKLGHLKQHVDAAKFRADRAFEQFDQCDPKNRQVAEVLEERLNERLVVAEQTRRHYEEQRSALTPLSPEQRRQIRDLGHHFESVWHHPNMDPTLKKQLLRLAIEDIIVKQEQDQIDRTIQNRSVQFTVRWSGGIHTQHAFKRNTLYLSSQPHPSLEEFIQTLAVFSDREIARLLNQQGILTPKGLKWSQNRVKNYRRGHRIRQVKDDDYLSASQASKALGISRHGLSCLVEKGYLENNWVTPYAPWRIRRTDLDREDVKRAVATMKARGFLAPKDQLTLLEKS